MSPLTDSELDRYVEGWKKRLQAEQEKASRRLEEARQEARRLSALLKHDFGATEVWVFGSLALHARGLKTFRADSDIDLAARGIPPERFFAACGRLLVDSGFSVDLVDLDDSPLELREAILKEGVLIAD